MQNWYLYNRSRKIKRQIDLDGITDCNICGRKKKLTELTDGVLRHHISEV